MSNNKDQKTVDGFGDEWERFDQSGLDEIEHHELFEKYFSIFPWNSLPDDSVGFDMGCGSGRWSKILAQRVGTLNCIDPSSALEVAKKNLKDVPNCIFHSAGVDEEPLLPSSQDFGVSLGALHHIPDTAKGIKACVEMLKPGAPFLLYLYYALDNRSFWFRFLWKMSDFVRFFVSKLPHGLRYLVSQIIAITIYWPLARSAKIIEKFGASESLVDTLPLSSYRNLSFYTMRTDALDRFGTRLEQRFTKSDIKLMMEEAGLEGIVFSENNPYWVAVGYRK
jgi:SAM-dependent methyltransferase